MCVWSLSKRVSNRTYEQQGNNNEDSNADLAVTQNILRANINNCIGNILFDNGAQVSLVNDSFRHRNKNRFGNQPLLLVANMMIHPYGAGQLQNIKNLLNYS